MTPEGDMELREELIEKTKKEIQKLEKELEPASPKKNEKRFLENIKAYISDSKHFMERGDLIRALEAVIFAWGVYEACLEMGMFGKS